MSRAVRGDVVGSEHRPTGSNPLPTLPPRRAWLALRAVLAEMDGFTGSEGIIVLAATNQPDVLDKALLRAGRLDRRVVVNLPDRAGRKAILEVHTRRVPLDADVDLEELAAAMPG